MNSRVVLVSIVVSILLVGAISLLIVFKYKPANPETTTAIVITSESSTTSGITPTTSSSVSSSSATTPSSVATSSSGVTSSSSFSTNTHSSATSSNPGISHTLKIDARLLNGTELTGLTVVVSTANATPQIFSIPASFTLAEGTYTITVNDVKNFVFANWNTGQTTRNMTIFLGSDTILVANYKFPGSQTLSVFGRTVGGKSVAGVWVTLYQNGNMVSSDVIPTNFTVNYGATYTIATNGAAYLLFRYWNGNQSQASPSYTFTVTGNTSLTAYYQEQPIPPKPSPKGNHTVTIIAHTLDGGPLIGAYFQVRFTGTWVKMADGFTPASVSLYDGTVRLVMYHCARIPGPCAEGKKFFIFRYYNDSAHTLTRWNDFPLSSNMVINSFYDVMPSSKAVHVVIQSLNASNYQPLFHCTCGALITIYYNGQPFAQSLTPYAFFLWKGANYTVTLGPLYPYTFIKWDNGVTTTTRTFVAQLQSSNMTDLNLYRVYKKG